MFKAKYTALEYMENLRRINVFPPSKNTSYIGIQTRCFLHYQMTEKRHVYYSNTIILKKKAFT
jgi:hypothetical protein